MSENLFDLSREEAAAFDEIPIIDLGPLINPQSTTTTEVKKAIAHSVSDACVNVGFFYVKNTGISPTLVDEAFEASKVFFNLPIEQKMKSVNPNSHFGYDPLLSVNVNPENKADLHEGFNFDCGIEEGQKGNSASFGARAVAPKWPEQPENFKEAVGPYYDAAVRLGRVLFQLFALSLNLPENFFDDKIQESGAQMAFLHYPPQPVNHEEEKRVQGIGEHTDPYCFTILRQGDISGLQVRNSQQQWVNAPPIKDTFVVNIGDQFAHWTNDLFRSTFHRVINRSGAERYSSPLFFGVDYDVIIEAFPSCVAIDKPAKYKPIKAGDFLKTRLSEIFDKEL